MKLLCFILIITCARAVYAQRKLILIKRNFIVSRFSEGERIRLKLRGDDTFTSAIITGIHSDFIKFGEADTVYLEQIVKIDLRYHSNNNFKIASSGKKLIVTGIVLLIADFLALNPSNTIHSGILIISSAFVSTGILLQFINNNYFKVNRKRKVTIGKF